MKRALVTGGTGFIGRRLVCALLREGVEVRATARGPAAAAELSALGAQTAPWSLDDTAIDRSLLEGVDTVFHLAAPRRTFDPITLRTSRPGDSILADGSARLTKAVAASAVARMIVTSSVAVYGKLWGESDESTPARPDSLYGRTRLDAEIRCRAAFGDRPERLVIARLTETFGPGSPGQFGLLREIAEGRFRLIGAGRALHHLSTVEDTVAGLLALARAETAGGALLNIGSAPHTLREFVESASDALGRPVRSTPWAGPPARALLSLLRSSPSLARRAPAMHALLDYQLRPRAFSIRRSLDLLGIYSTADFRACVAASARAARRAIPA